MERLLYQQLTHGTVKCREIQIKIGEHESYKQTNGFAGEWLESRFLNQRGAFFTNNLLTFRRYTSTSQPTISRFLTALYLAPGINLDKVPVYCQPTNQYAA